MSPVIKWFAFTHARQSAITDKTRVNISRIISAVNIDMIALGMRVFNASVENPASWRGDQRRQHCRHEWQIDSYRGNNAENNASFSRNCDVLAAGRCVERSLRESRHVRRAGDGSRVTLHANWNRGLVTPDNVLNTIILTHNRRTNDLIPLPRFL